MEAAGTGKTGTPRLSTKCTNWSNVVRSLFFVAIASACGEKLGGGNSSIHNATLLLSLSHSLSLASWRDPVFFLMLETEARGVPHGNPPNYHTSYVVVYGPSLLRNIGLHSTGG